MYWANPNLNAVDPNNQNADKLKVILQHPEDASLNIERDEVLAVSEIGFHRFVFTHIVYGMGAPNPYRFPDGKFKLNVRPLKTDAAGDHNPINTMSLMILFADYPIEGN